MRSPGIVLAALWLACVPAARGGSAPTPAPGGVRWTDDRLSVRVAEVPLDAASAIVQINQWLGDPKLTANQRKALEIEQARKRALIAPLKGEEA